MRVLLLLRGSAGVGKSTYIKEHGLEPYALSADNIRMMCQSPVMQTNGTLAISQSNERLVWSLLFQMLEARMQRGEFVVIDGNVVEGFVVEDNAGYMVKFKCYYYHLWKHMRSVAQEVFRSGQYRRMGSLLTPLENKFYGFCKEIRDREHPNHIIPLRDMFMQQLIESK